MFPQQCQKRFGVLQFVNGSVSKATKASEIGPHVELMLSGFFWVAVLLLCSLRFAVCVVFFPAGPSCAGSMSDFSCRKIFSNPSGQRRGSAAGGRSLFRPDPCPAPGGLRRRGHIPWLRPAKP